jgi:GTP cyclohydrolase I
MARNPGEWYAERAAEAERLGHELAGARKVLAALDGVTAGPPLRAAHMCDAAREVVRRLERRLEQARYVGD